MFNRIQVTTIFVSDQDKAKEFYTSKLGMTLKMDMPMGPDFRWVEVAPDGAETSLTLAKPYSGSGNVGGRSGIIFDTSDVNQLYETLRARGVTFRQPPTPQPWGAIEAVFADPDGNEFSVAQRTS